MDCNLREFVVLARKHGQNGELLLIDFFDQLIKIAFIDTSCDSKLSFQAIENRIIFSRLLKELLDLEPAFADCTLLKVLKNDPCSSRRILFLLFNND